jgi:hypothetical protein
MISDTRNEIGKCPSVNQDFKEKCTCLLAFLVFCAVITKYHRLGNV